MGMAFAQDATPGGPPSGMLGALITPIAIFVVFYFLMIRPQQKKSREQKDMLENLKTGDEIISTGGLYGTIVKFGDNDRVKVKIAENVTIEIARSALTGKVTTTTEVAKS
ncbi:preprotein translocase subunit YajC [Candidatus Methylomirabilis limnetica]|nr:preprotein translocase subunit YajC [Candidatus Methylomirabilis limnetica]